MRSLLVPFLLLPLLAACASSARGPLPVQHAPPLQPSAAPPLVIVLPGRFDTLASVERSGVVDSIRFHWPQAEVQVVAAGLGHYLQTVLPQRLHREVIEPARARRVSQIWLVGASLGGMGALLYEHAYPGTVDGIVLLAPYLGDDALVGEIAAAGGLQRWNPGPAWPMSADNWQRQPWRLLRRLPQRPELAQRLWLAYGTDDRLAAAYPLITPLLAPSQVIERPGDHRWDVWVPALAEIFARVRRGQSLARAAADD